MLRVSAAARYGTSKRKLTGRQRRQGGKGKWRITINRNSHRDLEQVRKDIRAALAAAWAAALDARNAANDEKREKQYQMEVLAKRIKEADRAD